MIESKAFATVGAAYPRRCTGWRGAGCFALNLASDNAI
jgi:hypothetical protein